MKAACLILAALAVGASAAPTVTHGGGGRWRPVVCAVEHCIVPAGGTCGESTCKQCFPTWATGGTDLTNCDTECVGQNCLRCNMTNAGQCLECANDGTDPFYLNSEGKCAECTAANCATRRWERKFMMAGGCRADGFCKKCAKGFGRATDNNCVACDSADPNCAVCSQDNVAVCFRCKPSFFWDGTACTACNPDRVVIEGCASCPAQGVCRDCLVGYAKVWNWATRTLTCEKCPDGCARCEPDGRCNACVPKETVNGQTTFWVYDQVSRTCYGPFVDNA